MRPCRLILLVPLAISLAGPAAADTRADAYEVHVRGIFDGAIVRVPGADLSDCEVLRPSPTVVVLAIRDHELTSRPIVERTEWIRSISALGPDAVGSDESRLVIETVSSAL